APKLPPVAGRELLGLFWSTLNTVDTAGRVLRGLPFRVVDVIGWVAVDFTGTRTKVEWLRRAARELGYCLVPLGPEEPTFGETKGKVPAPPLLPRALPPAAARSPSPVAAATELPIRDALAAKATPGAASPVAPDVLPLAAVAPAEALQGSLA
ncbi:hypothetical protein KEM52_000351, partial [Ascosphaera acerosa]